MSKGNPNTPTSLGAAPPPVFVGPGVDARVAAQQAGMAARAAARRGGGLPKYSEPVAGGAPPPIPRLDGPYQERRTMAAQAEDVNSLPQHAQLQQAMQASQPGSIIEQPGFMPHTTAPRMALQPGDMLPEEAMRDPEFRNGMGATAAMAQPHLAQRYGVIRNGMRLAPQALMSRPTAPHVVGDRVIPRGAETLRDLSELQRVSLEQRTKNLPKTEAEAEAQARTATALPEEEKRTTEEEEKKVKEAISAMDSFDYDRLRQMMNRDHLNDPKQKEIIEDRLKALPPLDLETLILTNRVSQDVPIVPGKFTPKFTSMTGEEDLKLKQLIMTESKSIEVTDRYLLDKYGLMALTVGLTAINSNVLPSHLDKNGEFDDAKFWEKFKWVTKRPLHMLASLHNNFTWFEMRVRKLFVMEKVGNG